MTLLDSDTTGMDWLLFAIAAVLLYVLVVKGNSFVHGRSSPEEKGRLLLLSAVFSLVWRENNFSA